MTPDRQAGQEVELPELQSSAWPTLSATGEAKNCGIRCHCSYHSLEEEKKSEHPTRDDICRVANESGHFSGWTGGYGRGHVMGNL